ncbi:hypothetical protein BDC45DRAFT_99764 [Circinella umbellata]|nr:hypothetical protein BDC45DRAFT_99764 [Circinella umbellata]
MASATSSNQFDAPTGTYSVRLGNSFTSPGSKDAASYYTFKFNSRLNPTMSLRKATLEKTDNDSYTAEWDALEGNNSKDNTQLNYDATPSQPQEVDCILLYDEVAQTFILQRPTLKFTMRKSRKRKVVKPQLPEPKAPKTTQVASKMPAKTVPGAASSPSTTKPGKKSTGSKTAPKKLSTPSSATTEVTDQRRSSVDDFAMDIESQMMDILEDDDDDDDDEDEVADISRSLSADTQSVPPSPSAARSHNTPVVPERSPYSASPATRGTPNKNGGPMSLRALYDDGDQGEEDEGITSSDSGSDDD